MDLRPHVDQRRYRRACPTPLNIPELLNQDVRCSINNLLRFRRRDVRHVTGLDLAGLATVTSVRPAGLRVYAMHDQLLAIA